MEAPPVSTVQGDESILSQILCKEHPYQKIVGICTDKRCNEEEKYMCVECIFGKHSGHVGTKAGDIENIYKEISEVNYNLDKIINMKYSELADKLKKAKEELKKKVEKIIDDYYYKEIIELKNLYKFKLKEQLDNINRYKIPKNKDELIQLANEFIILHDNKDIIDLAKDKNEIEKKYSDFEKKEHRKKLYLERKLIDIINSKEEIQYEWSYKVYGPYQFEYRFDDNNTRATKCLNDEEMSICRGLAPLIVRNRYKIDYFLDNTNGIVDIGLGDESIGPTGKLRDNHSYCISTDGIFANGKIISQKYHLSKVKKISFKVDLNNYNCEIYLEDKKIFNLNLKQDLVYFPMIAISNLNNSVKIKVTNLDES
jgi:hypothetical protein